MKKSITLLLFWYRLVLATTKWCCMAIAVTFLLFLVARHAEGVLYLLDLISPVTGAVKAFMWAAFPLDVMEHIPQWAHDVGRWLGRKARGALTKLGARDQAVARLLLLDGLLLLSLMSWALCRVVGVYVNWKVARWFRRRYVILTRLVYNMLVESAREADELRETVAQQADEIAQLRRTLSEKNRELDALRSAPEDPHQRFDEAVAAVRKLRHLNTRRGRL
jgi:hypothetical protein